MVVLDVCAFCLLPNKKILLLATGLRAGRHHHYQCREKARARRCARVCGEFLELIHLGPTNKKNLRRRLLQSLRQQGTLCLGWVDY